MNNQFVTVPVDVLWNAITGLERSSWSESDRLAVADQLRTIASAPESTAQAPAPVGDVSKIVFDALMNPDEKFKYRALSISNAAPIEQITAFAEVVIRAALSAPAQQVEAAQQWQVMADDDPYKRLTEMKTKSIIERDGYRVSGYILNKGDKMCLSYGQAIRWMDAKQLFSVMHAIPEAAQAPGKLEAVTTGEVLQWLDEALEKIPSSLATTTITATPLQLAYVAGKMAKRAAPVQPAAITAELLLRSVFVRTDLTEHGREQFFKDFMEGREELTMCWGDFRTMAATARAAIAAPVQPAQPTELARIPGIKPVHPDDLAALREKMQKEVIPQVIDVMRQRQESAAKLDQPPQQEAQQQDRAQAVAGDAERYLAALLELRNWFESERKSISKGNGSQWSMWQCEEQIAIIDAARASQEKANGN